MSIPSVLPLSGANVTMQEGKFLYIDDRILTFVLAGYDGITDGYAHCVGRIVQTSCPIFHQPR